MTMRTYRYFLCLNGHSGVERKSENDQPYSDPWESIETGGVKERGAGKPGYPAYVCTTCGEPMTETKTRPDPLPKFD